MKTIGEIPQAEAGKALHILRLIDETKLGRASTRNLERTIAGIFLPTQHVLLPSVPSDEIRRGHLSLPKPKARSSSVLIADTTLASEKLIQEKMPEFSNVALAQLNIPRYLAELFTKRLPKTKEVAEVLDVLRSCEYQDPIFVNSLRTERMLPTIQCSPSALTEKYEPAVWFDKNTEAQHKYYRRTASPLEQVSLSLLEESASNPAINQHRVLLALLHLLRTYSSQIQNGETLRMPEFTEHVLFDFQAESHQISTDLLNIMEKVEISASEAEKLLWLMDDKKILDHRLSFKLSVQLAQEKPESPWLIEQKKRKSELLELLRDSPQQLFDTLPELQQKASGLVCSHDFTNLFPGKVGYEIEYNSELPPGSLPYGLDLENQGEHLEVKTSEDAVELDISYFQRLYDLSLWLTESHAKPYSLHLHLDTNQHQYRPSLLNLATDYRGINDDRQGRPTIEHTGLVLPTDETKTSFDVAALADLISLFSIQSTRANEHPPSNKIELSRLTHERDLTITDFIFGHLASATRDPEVRLCGLLTLRNPYSLRAIDPTSLLATFEMDGLQRFITETDLRKCGFSEFQILSFSLLVQFIDGLGWQEIVNWTGTMSKTLSVYLKNLLLILAESDDPKALIFLKDAMNAPINHSDITEIARIAIQSLVLSTQTSAKEILFEQLNVNPDKWRKELIIEIIVKEKPPYFDETMQTYLLNDAVSEEIKYSILDKFLSYPTYDLQPYLDIVIKSGNVKMQRKTLNIISKFDTYLVTDLFSRYLTLYSFHDEVLFTMIDALTNDDHIHDQQSLQMIRTFMHGSNIEIAMYACDELLDAYEIANINDLMYAYEHFPSLFEKVCEKLSAIEGVGTCELIIRILTDNLNACVKNPDKNQNRAYIVLLIHKLATYESHMLVDEVILKGFHQHPNAHVKFEYLRASLSRPNIDKIPLFNSQLTSANVNCLNVIELCAKLTDADFTLVCSQLFTILKENSKYENTTATLSILLARGSAEIVTRTWDFFQTYLNTPTTHSFTQQWIAIQSLFENPLPEAKQLITSLLTQNDPDLLRIVNKLLNGETEIKHDENYYLEMWHSSLDSKRIEALNHLTELGYSNIRQILNLACKDPSFSLVWCAIDKLANIPNEWADEYLSDLLENSPYSAIVEKTLKARIKNGKELSEQISQIITKYSRYHRFDVEDIYLLEAVGKYLIENRNQKNIVMLNRLFNVLTEKVSGTNNLLGCINRLILHRALSRSQSVTD